MIVQLPWGDIVSVRKIEGITVERDGVAWVIAVHMDTEGSQYTSPVYALRLQAEAVRDILAAEIFRRELRCLTSPNGDGNDGG
jgi:aspartate aminotransferase-like enzyme